MFVKAVTAKGFRGMDCRVPISAPLSLLVGENNVGKSTVIDVFRLLFAPEAGPRARRWITAADFSHDGAGVPTCDEFTLSAELHGLTPSERGRMVTCLAPSLGSNAARIRLRARIGADGRINTEWFGGDSEHPDVERWAREAITYTYLPPLRDAGADLRPGRDNKLVSLLSTLAPEGHADRNSLEAILEAANQQLASVGSIAKAEHEVQSRLSSLTGGGMFSQKTSLQFASPKFERIVAALRALAGHVVPLELDENGLGYNNLLYMSVLLAALAQEQQSGLRVLLVEEPEAHLHPQLQDLLMQYLEDEGATGNTQVVVTSHSPQFASSARVERLTVLARAKPGAPVTAHAPEEFGLPKASLDHLRRFLDVTKASLLFARGVILVEGIAEQLVLPSLADRLGKPFSKHGVALINVQGLAFRHFVDLFRNGGLPFRCALVSDADPSQVVDDDGTLIDVTLSNVARSLQAIQNDRVRVFLSKKTFEWDLAAESSTNWPPMMEAFRHVKPVVTKRISSSSGGSANELASRADTFLEKVTDVKGLFAQELSRVLSEADDAHPFEVPAYIAEAIDWVTG